MIQSWQRFLLWNPTTEYKLDYVLVISKEFVENNSYFPLTLAFVLLQHSASSSSSLRILKEIVLFCIVIVGRKMDDGYVGWVSTMLIIKVTVFMVKSFKFNVMLVYIQFTWWFIPFVKSYLTFTSYVAINSNTNFGYSF